MIPDDQLLRRYVREDDETAFTELVRRYVDMVYSTALRLAGGDAHLAQDVSQSVFTDLARKAWRLSDRATLAGWLHTSVRYAAAKIRRGEFRRRVREQEAYLMQESTTLPEAHWEQLQPLLDEAVGSLREADRDLVALRFFQNKTHREIGDALGLGEEAARKRVDRALEKLRVHFARRGVTVSAGLLLATITANSVQAAPVGLAGSLTGVSLAGSGGGGLAAMFFKTIYMSTKTKIIITAMIVAGLAAIPLEIQQQQIKQLRVDLAKATSKAHSPAKRDDSSDLAAKLNNEVALAQSLQTKKDINFQSVLNLLQTLPKSNSNDSLIKGMLGVWVGTDPDAATAYVTSLKGTPAFDALIADLAAIKANSDLNAALAWAQSLPMDGGQSAAVDAVLKQLTSASPQQALGIIQQLPDGGTTNTLMENFIMRLADKSPAQAAQAIASLSPGANITQVTMSVAGKWIQQDPMAASQWIDTISDDDSRNVAVRKLIEAQTTSDPSASFIWAASIRGNETMRGNQLNNVVKSWSSKDPAAATAAIQSANVTDQLRQRLLKNVQNLAPTN